MFTTSNSPIHSPKQTNHNQVVGIKAQISHKKPPLYSNLSSIVSSSASNISAYKLGWQSRDRNLLWFAHYFRRWSTLGRSFGCVRFNLTLPGNYLRFIRLTAFRIAIPTKIWWLVNGRLRNVGVIPFFINVAAVAFVSRWKDCGTLKSIEWNERF